MAASRLHELSAQGVSVWFDTLSRELLETGELERMTHDDAVVGVTSNPTIFQKALAEGAWYDAQLQEVAARESDAKKILFALAVEDIKDACDLLQPACLGVDCRCRRPRLARGRARPRLRPRRDVRAGDRAARARRPSELLRQDSCHPARARRDRGLHRQGQVDQRHVDLLAQAPCR